MAGLKAVLLGASGLVGGELLRQLLEDDGFTRVTALVRRPLGVTHARLEEQVVDFGRLEEHAALFEADCVFCCLGTTRAKTPDKAAYRAIDRDYPLAAASLALKRGARSYLIVTAIGADPASRVFYSRLKGEVEADLAKLGYPALHIFRPSFLLGKRGESRLAERAGIALFGALSFLMAGPLRRYRPIEAGAVAFCMKEMAKREERGAFIHESDEIRKFAPLRRVQAGKGTK